MSAPNADTAKSKKTSDGGGDGYPIMMEGDWVQPVKRGFNMACCSCGLVHRINFRITPKNKIKFQVFRNAKDTNMLRRRNGIKITWDGKKHS